MTSHKRITVITPCFNCERYNGETIQSIIHQTYKPIEHIVIDDGSTDNSIRVIESYGNHVRLITQVNHGVSYARNKGISEAKGDYIVFLDGDDLLYKDALKELIELVDDSNTVAIMGANYFYRDLENITKIMIPTATGFFPEIIKNNFAPIHSWLFPKKLIKEAGGFFDEQQMLWEDWYLWCQIGLLDAKLVSTEFVGAYYRIHENSITRSTQKKEQNLGYAHLIKRLANGFQKQPEYINNYGITLFWGAWTALKTCRSSGSSWNELNDLIGEIDKILPKMNVLW